MVDASYQPFCQDEWLGRVQAALAALHATDQTMTYLEFADHLGLPGPHRIHRLGQLLEASMACDVEQGRTPRAALVVSRARDGLPAPGFFECAQALGIMGAKSPKQCHQDYLAKLAQERVTCAP